MSRFRIACITLAAVFAFASTLGPFAAVTAEEAAAARIMRGNGEKPTGSRPTGITRDGSHVHRSGSRRSTVPDGSCSTPSRTASRSARSTSARNTSLPGRIKNVEIDGDHGARAEGSGTMFILMLHSDVDDDGTFDFVFVDPPHVADKAVIEGTTMVAHAIKAP